MRLTRSKPWLASTLAWIALATVSPAQTLVQRSFDFELHGDDPGEVFPFQLTPDLLIPIQVRFEGSFLNLASDATSVRYDLIWTTRDGTSMEGYIGGEFVPLGGLDSLPLSFEHSIDFTPETVLFLAEGGGPGDHLRFTGDLTLTQVPEPGMLWLMTVVVIGVLAGCLRRPSRQPGP